jgi:hypothetical protein
MRLNETERRDEKPDPKSQSFQTAHPELTLVSHRHTKSRIPLASLGSPDPAFYLLLSRTISRGRQGKEGWQPMVSLYGYSKVLEF